jgi:two-component system NarL family response regulator
MRAYREAGKIRILLADDHAILREGVAAILNTEPDIEVVAQAGTGRKAVDLYREYRPDIGLIDIEMPDGDGPEAISVIREFDPGARLIVLTTYLGEEDIYRAMSAGAKGYLLKGETPEVLTGCIRTVAAGGIYLPGNIAEKLAERLPGEDLSGRELDVLRLLVTGKTNLEIAGTLGITESTVKFHVNHVLSKLRVTDRTQAVVTALRKGLVRLS